MRYKVTNPLEVEFSTGRISPYLQRTVAEITAAWEQLHRGDDLSADEIEEDMCPRKWDEDGVPDEDASTGSIENILPPEAHRIPGDYSGITKSGEALCYLKWGMPASIKDTNPTRLRGAECRANAGLILQRLEYRAGSLWPVVLGAVVFRKTMAAIGGEHGGNTASAAGIGRALVVHGLRLCARALDEMVRGQTTEEARRYVPMCLPTKSIAVENAIMRRIARAPGRPLGPENTNVLR